MGNNNYKIYFKVAYRIVKKAGELLLKNFRGKREVTYKGRIDLVTEMDTKSENMIVSRLKKKFPEHGIMSEEREPENTDSKYTWIIDPLDGTTNYTHGFGLWGVSVALKEKEQGIVLGLVYAPYLNEYYYTVKGGGAYLNGKKIKVSETEKLEKSMVATGFPYDIKQSHDNIEYFNRFLLKARAVRRPGSAAIDLCSVASGIFDGFWEMKLFPWDMAAGSIIVSEAGGKITDFKGDAFNPFKKTILATNGIIHEQMKVIINA
ncbi:MAG: inositol monophosphatase family protein [Elusimicrobiota bacterium]